MLGIAPGLRENCFSGWEAFFAAYENNSIIGFCSFMKEDYYPENRYYPWISSIFVDEKMRGQGTSHKLIAVAENYAKECQFSKVYIPSDMKGFYEKCGYSPIDELLDYGGGMDTIFMKELKN